MTEDKSQLQQMKPYIVVAAILLVLLIVLMLWPGSDEPSQANNAKPNTTEIELPAPAIEPPDEPLPEPELFEAPQMPSEVVIGEEVAEVEVLAPVVTAVEEVPLDISDAAVKVAIVQAIRSPTISRFLVNDALLEKFVINVNDLANRELTLKDNLLVPPSRNFQVYQQADKIWMDRSSFTRYTPYVQALESVDASALLSAYEQYKPSLTEKFSEISRPGDELDDTLIKAINELLSTPEVDLPIEVISETVMYKFADPAIEALSAPQKQLIRMGPDNMNRLKAVLREVKAELEGR